MVSAPGFFLKEPKPVKMFLHDQIVKTTRISSLDKTIEITKECQYESSRTCRSNQSLLTHGKQMHALDSHYIMKTFP